MLYEIITMIFWPVDYVGEDILMSAVVLNDWYRWTSLMIVIPSFLVLVCMGHYDNIVPWISGLYAACRAGMLVACFILMMNWWTAIVAKEKDEQPVGQQPNWCLHKRRSNLEPSGSTELGSNSGQPDKEPYESSKESGEPDKESDETHSD
jgi:hypothetical protein